MPTKEQVKKTIKALLLSSKHGCSPTQLMNDYQHYQGEKIPYLNLGYDSLMIFLSSLRDVVSVSRTPSGVLLYAVSQSKNTKNSVRLDTKQKSSHCVWTTAGEPRLSCVIPAPRSDSDSSFSQVPATFKTKLKTLMLSYPDGVPLGDFQEAFARRFSYYFTFRNWGFTTIEEVLQSIPEILYVENDRGKKTVYVKKVEDASTKLPSREKTKGLNWEALDKERKASECSKEGNPVKKGKKGKSLLCSNLLIPSGKDTICW